MLVRCINCELPCQKYGKTSAGIQRWYFTACHISFVNKIDNTTKQLKEFLTWLFSKTTQQELPSKGRTSALYLSCFLPGTALYND